MTRAPNDSAEREGAPQLTIADVLVPVALDAVFSWRVPPGMAVQPGDYVSVPFSKTEATGIVWALHDGAGSNLKAIDGLRDAPRMGPGLRSFIDWVARWTLAPRGMVARMAMRTLDVVAPERPQIGYRLTDIVPGRMTPARARVIAAAEGGLVHSKRDLAEAAACSPGIVDALADCGTLETVVLPAVPAALPPEPGFAPPVLEAAQASAVAQLVAAVETRAFAAILLEGVTGSGKTEVCFEAVAAALKSGGQALILMPEIALTGQVLDRFAARFGVRPAEWHSGLSPRKRARIWAGVASGEVKAVVGARSALFMPFADLRLIVVDEEHDPGYKQEDGVNYHARDMAVVRAQIENATVVLASATPALESRVNAMQGRYQHVVLADRVGGRTMPDIVAIDLKRNPAPRGQWLAPTLREAVTQTLAKGEQSLLFLNRRGYAPLTLCRFCGHRFQCPQCTAWLVDHRFRRALVCHHCGHVERRPEDCPECDAVDSLTPVGPGIERLAEEVAVLWPDARTLLLSSDFHGGIQRVRDELDAVARGEFDIVIGTRLVAKGHNFPSLTLVGVVDADVGLASGDPRAAERTFQLLQQVTGRAGRGAAAGRGLLQSWQPSHPVIKAIIAGDAEGFYREEIAARRAGGLPPFGRLAALIVSGKDRAAAEAHARALVRAAHEFPPDADGNPLFTVAGAGGLPEGDDIMLLGPAEAPLAMVRARYRFRLLVKTSRKADLQGFLRAMIAHAPKPRGSVQVAIDVDPQTFL